MIKGADLTIVWKETLVLMGIMAFLLFLSIKKFKIRLA
jgi:ABC-2 type transport system permease protein